MNEGEGSTLPYRIFQIIIVEEMRETENHHENKKEINAVSKIHKQVLKLMNENFRRNKVFAHSQVIPS